MHKKPSFFSIIANDSMLGNKRENGEQERTYMKINFKIRGSPEELAEFFRKIREIKIVTVSDEGRENTVLRRSRELLEKNTERGI